MDTESEKRLSSSVKRPNRRHIASAGVMFTNGRIFISADSQKGAFAWANKHIATGNVKMAVIKTLDTTVWHLGDEWVGI